MIPTYERQLLAQMRLSDLVESYYSNLTDQVETDSLTSTQYKASDFSLAFLLLLKDWVHRVFSPLPQAYSYC